MKVVIVGCSRLGARLADSLDRESHSVTIIDVDTTAFRRLNSVLNQEQSEEKGSVVPWARSVRCGAKDTEA